MTIKRVLAKHTVPGSNLGGISVEKKNLHIAQILVDSGADIGKSFLMFSDDGYNTSDSESESESES